MGLFDWLRARTGATADDASPAEPRPEPSTASPGGAARADWATLPAMPSIAPTIEPVVDRRFDRSLAAWQSPLVLRPLDHAVSADAPSGLILARAHRDAEARVAEGRSPAPTTSAATAVQRAVALDGPRRPAPVIAVPARPLPVTAVGEPAPAVSVSPAAKALPDRADAPAVADESVVTGAELSGPAPRDEVTPEPAPTVFPPADGPAGAPMPAGSVPTGLTSADTLVQRRASETSLEPAGSPLDVAPLVGATDMPVVTGSPPGSASTTGSAPVESPTSVGRGLGGAVARATVERAVDAAGPSGPVPAAAAPAGEPDSVPYARRPLLGDRPATAATQATVGPPPGSGPSAPVVQRLGTPGAPARRAGLGAPLRSVPQPAAPATSMPASSMPASSVPATSVPVAAAPQAAPPPDLSVRPSPALPDVGPGSTLLTGLDGPGADLRPDVEAVAPLLGDRSPQVAMPSVAPLDGALGGASGGGRAGDPVGSPVVQRQVAPQATSLPADGPIETLPEPVEAARRGAVDEPSASPTASLLGDRPPMVGVRPTLARDDLAPAGSPSSVLPGSAGSSAGGPSVQRAVPAGLPAATGRVQPWGSGPTPVGSDRGSWVDAGAVAVASGVAQRDADGSVVFDPPADGSPSEQAVVQREGADAGSGGGGATTGGATGATSTAGASGAELDELAKRLYSRMRLLLKQELRHDRERAGSLTRTRR